jgi:hypothetical protein
MSYLSELGQAIMDALVQMWNSFATAVPGLFLALIIILVGYLVGSAIGLLIRKLMDKAQVDAHIRRAGFAHSIGFISIPKLVGGVTRWWIFAIFLGFAAEKIEFKDLSMLMRLFASWVPSLIAAMVIMLFGLVLADFLADRMLHAKRQGVRLVSSFVRWFVIIFVAIIALQQMGIEVSLLSNSLLILIAGAALGLGIALGVGFGNAFKDEAKNVIKAVKKGL